MARNRSTRLREKQAPPAAAGPTSPPAGTVKFSPALWATLVCLVTFACFWPACSFNYITWDDNINITGNVPLNASHGPDFLYYWRHDFQLAYRPVMYDIWSLIAVFSRLHVPRQDAAVGVVNFDPHGFHTATVIAHIVNALLVYLLLRLLVKQDWASAAGALLFAIHPLQDESVAWITGGNLAFFGTFALLGLYQYLLYSIFGQDGVQPERRRIHYVMSFLWYICALLTYPVAVVLPVIAGMIDCWMLRRRLKDAIVSLAPWLILTVPWVIVTAMAKFVHKPITDVKLLDRPFVAGDALSWYLGKLFLPLGLTVDYGRTPASVLSHPWVYATSAVSVLFVVLLARVYRRWPALTCAGGIFIVGLAPSLGIITNPIQLYSTVADRYIYLSMLGPAIAAAWALSQVKLQSRDGMYAAGAAAIFLSALAVLVVPQVLRFRNDDTLFPYVLKRNPQSWAMAMNYGIYLRNSGRVDEAQKKFEQTLQIEPHFPQAHEELANLLAAKGDHAGAAANLTDAVDHTSPPDPGLFTELGQQQAANGDYADAIDNFQQALSISPADTDAMDGLGIALGNSGKRAEAVTVLAAAVRLKADDTRALDNMGLFLAQENKLDAAIAAWREALQKDPGYEKAYVNIGYALRMEGKPADALAAYRSALAIVPNDPRALAAIAALPTGGDGQPR
jgi:tetratricopeptide (TPR) repeat protein